MKENSFKSDESNRKRLESLKQQAEEFKLKKSLIKNSLNSLDGDSKPKKIIFKDSDSDTEIVTKKAKQGDPVKQKPTNLKNESKKIDVKVEKKKFKLIGSDDDDDNENSGDDDDANEAKKMFESKLNLNEKQANKLIYLKSKYSNDDKRFKIDERFVEDEESGVVPKKLKKSKRKNDSDDEDDEDDSVLNQKNKLNMADDDYIPKTNRKQIKNENLNSLKILEQITGKQILKPQAPVDESQMEGHHNGSKKINKMIRYDPTKDEHKQFEITKEDSLSDSDEETDRLKSTSEQELKNATPKIEEDLSKFYEIEPNLKELFSSNDVFKFKFTNDEKDDSENELYNNEEPMQKLKDFSSFEVNKRQKKSKYSSSEDEDTDDGENEYEEDEDTIKKSSKENQEKQIKKFENLKLTELPKTFLPDFVNSKEIKEGLAFFKKVEYSREEWLKQREFLVKDYKKKHKRMIRIKKSKENEKLLPWKLNKTSSNSKK